MTILTAASTQWATRPADQRFTSLTALHEHVSTVRERSHAKALHDRFGDGRMNQARDW